MPTPKKLRAEIMRPPVSVDPATLDRLIQQRVAEALAHEDHAIMEPWFQPQRIAHELRRHQSVFHQRKFALYYEKWGCLVCGRKSIPHSQNGMCQRCGVRFVQRLKALERDYAKAHPQEYQQQQIESLTSRVRDAERILGIARPAIEGEEEE